MTQTSYFTINSLKEFSFIAGDEQILIFSFVNDLGIPIDITTGIGRFWKMSPYGQPDIVSISKTTTDTTIVDSSTFSINLLGIDTSILSGKYMHQVGLIDGVGRTFRPAQGVITIIPQIN